MKPQARSLGCHRKGGPAHEGLTAAARAAVARPPEPRLVRRLVLMVVARLGVKTDTSGPRDQNRPGRQLWPRGPLARTPGMTGPPVFLPTPAAHRGRWMTRAS